MPVAKKILVQGILVIVGIVILSFINPPRPNIGDEEPIQQVSVSLGEFTEPETSEIIEDVDINEEIIIPSPEPKSPISQTSPLITRKEEDAVSSQEETKKEEKEIPLEAKDINVQSITGIQCNFENSAGKIESNRGSGVFVGTEGYILTNRHLVDREWTNDAYGEAINTDYQLKDCDVRFYDHSAFISSSEADRRFFELSQPDFKAEVAHIPDDTKLSVSEKNSLDYAVLKITKKNPSKYTESEYPKIHTSPIFLPNRSNFHRWHEEIKGKKILSAGFPFQGISARVDLTFQQYRLFVKEGFVSEIYGGDGFFLNRPFLLQVEVEPDAYGGRSGSPIFYKGYIIGLTMRKEVPLQALNYKHITGTQISISAIRDSLGDEKAEIFFSDVYIK